MNFAGEDFSKRLVYDPSEIAERSTDHNRGAKWDFAGFSLAVKGVLSLVRVCFSEFHVQIFFVTGGVHARP